LVSRQIFAMKFSINTHNFSSAIRSLFVYRWLPLLIFLFLVIVYVSFFFFLGGVTQTEGSIPPDQLIKATDSKIELSLEPETVKKEKAGTIKKGDTITALLGNYLSTEQILQLVRQSKNIFSFSKLCIGQPYKIFLMNGQFNSLLYNIDRDEQLLIQQHGNEFEISRIPIDYDLTTEVINGTITSSLFDAVAKIGEEAELAINLADIFAWDIDFILDIRKGDSFRAVVEKRFLKGHPVGYGRILAAEFVNQGKSYRAILFRDESGNTNYYDPEGRNLRKGFLKAPLDFTRISSGFTMRRYHPITKTWKAHPAIDYVAPTGTPIKTVGEGTVKRIGRTRGNGNFIEILHSNGYSTLYLHMSKFAKGITKGKRVTPGQIIGYVGATGLATGPHLCFRMRKNGKPVNPNKVKMPKAPAVPSENMAEFRTLAAPLLAQLRSGDILQAKLESH
jgi:murein DD-endopeptidase MepM/ murein hydrolase activator NlpD